MMDQLLDRDTGEPGLLADVSTLSIPDRTMETEDLNDETVEDRRDGEDTEVISEVISDSDSSHSQVDFFFGIVVLIYQTY